MPTYLYYCEIHGEFEYEHSIAEELEYCPKCELEAGGDLTLSVSATTLKGRRSFQKVKKLISGGTGFILSGDGWARDNYSK
jgi:DNA-binding helix-hairpin-helix protein with protein kinase domain